MKTRAGGDKVFVNVCHSPEVPPPPPVSPPGLQRLLREPPGPDGAFRIPMSLGEPHAELDRGQSPPPGAAPLTPLSPQIPSERPQTPQEDGAAPLTTWW